MTPHGDPHPVDDGETPTRRRVSWLGVLCAWRMALAVGLVALLA